MQQVANLMMMPGVAEMAQQMSAIYPQTAGHVTGVQMSTVFPQMAGAGRGEQTAAVPTAIP